MTINDTCLRLSTHPSLATVLTITSVATIAMHRTIGSACPSRRISEQGEVKAGSDPGVCAPTGRFWPGPSKKPEQNPSRRRIFTLGHPRPGRSQQCGLTRWSARNRQKHEMNRAIFSSTHCVFMAWRNGVDKRPAVSKRRS